ncbi:MAG: putative transport system ATP-binding protein [Acidobacteriota bacterium]|nr:putative transport system ATP-binding protein [Acidobacteriota bacterium]
MHISLQHVSHDYAASSESAPVHVLDDVSLDIASGDFAVLRGASGSGKSTLLNLIGAVDRPTRGQLFLGDVDTSKANESSLTQLRRTQVGFIFQFFNLIPTLSVFENVAFPLSLAKRPKGEIRERADEVLRRVGLAHRATHFPNELSGGEMQRVAIGRAIVHRPPLILADEPTGNLDSKNGALILELIREVHQALRPTIVMATHSDVAAEFGDYVIHVADGHVNNARIARP